PVAHGAHRGNIARPKAVVPGAEAPPESGPAGKGGSLGCCERSGGTHSEDGAKQVRIAEVADGSAAAPPTPVELEAVPARRHNCPLEAPPSFRQRKFPFALQ